MRKVEDIINAAMVRAGSLVSAQGPIATDPLFQRLISRERFLFARAAGLNPAFYWSTAIVPVNAAGIADYGTGFPRAIGVFYVSIADPGSSPYPPGRQVTLIDPRESGAVHLAPRAFHQQVERKLVGYKTDLSGVGSVEISSALAPPTPVGYNSEVTIPEPYEELLVVDLAKFILTKYYTDAARSGGELALKYLDEDEARLLTAFDAAVRVNEFFPSSAGGSYLRPLNPNG
ncbi:MAG: hypothetical protein ONB52_21930 [candidate division KSB1 bacterium]|nr:hypothetical protein [candidate division KSB1 bacterium]